MSAGVRVHGLTAVGKPTVCGHDVSGVTEVWLGNAMLQRIPPYEMMGRLCDGAHGRPMYYAVTMTDSGRTALEFYPRPEQVYNITLTWDGIPQRYNVIALPPGWETAYGAALKAAKALMAGAA